MNHNQKAYEDLFKSFVSGGGLDNNFDDTLDDTFDDNFDDNFDGGARKKGSPKPKKAAAPKKAKKAAAPKKAKKVVDDNVKEVEVDIFTVVQSSVGVSGGTYKSRTPRSAALKAAGSLFKSGSRSTRSLKFVMQKITPHSNKRVYAYEATLEIFDEPEIVIKHDKNGKEVEIAIKRKVSIRKIEVDDEIRREQKEALKLERKAEREKAKAKMMKEERAEMRARGEKVPRKADKPKKVKADKPKKVKADKPKKVKADKQKKEKADKKADEELLKRADKLLTAYSKSIEENKKKVKRTAKGKKQDNFWGGNCSSNSCY